LYVSLFLSFTKRVYYLSGFIKPKQTDTLVRYAKEEGNKWFTKIYSVVKNESKNIEVSTNVILTEISVYNVR